MDAFSLRKCLIRLSLSFGLAALGLLVWWGVQYHANLMRNEGGARLCGNKSANGPVQQYVRPTAEEVQSYVGIAEEIAMAYSNGQVSAMQEWVNRFPKEAYRLRGDDLVKIIQPINRLWFRECGRIDLCEDFATPVEFEQQMEMRLALTKIYGNFIVDSGETAVSELGTFDVTILKQLQEYKDKFKRDGKSEYLPAAERLIAEWIEQIESERGFTREYARSQRNGLRRLVERGEVTEEVLMANVRIYPLLLKERCGYTPKWLDEEFPAAPVARH